MFLAISLHLKPGEEYRQSAANSSLQLRIHNEQALADVSDHDFIKSIMSKALRYSFDRLKVIMILWN